MKINITKKQYETLAKTVYLGDWMANAHRTGRTDDPNIEKYRNMHDFIFSFAEDFGYGKHFEHELEYDEHGTTTEINRLQEEYDKETFWDELCEILGKRDFFRKYHEEQIKKMNHDEYFMKIQECIIEWENEAEEYGIERLEIKHDNAN